VLLSQTPYRAYLDLQREEPPGKGRRRKRREEGRVGFGKGDLLHLFRGD